MLIAMTVEAAVPQVDPRSATARVHALEATDLQAAPSIRESLIEVSLLDPDEAEAITDAVMVRLTATGANVPTAQARKRLWLLLANHRFGGIHGPIARQDVAEQLAAAYAEGDHELRVNVGQQLWRIEQPLRAPLASAMRAALPTEDDYLTVSSAIGALFQTDELSGPALQYVEGIAQDLTNAHPDLHDKIFNQYEPLIGWPSEDGERLQTTALAAVMGSKPDLATAVQYAQSRPDDNPHVAEAMYRALNRYHDEDYPGDHPADNTGKDSTTQERAAWITEYTRRFCFDVSAPHRKKTALRAYIYMLHTYPDSQDALCDAFDHIIASLDQASREYQSAIEYRDGMCD